MRSAKHASTLVHFSVNAGHCLGLTVAQSRWTYRSFAHYYYSFFFSYHSFCFPDASFIESLVKPTSQALFLIVALVFREFIECFSDVVSRVFTSLVALPLGPLIAGVTDHFIFTFAELVYLDLCV